jgi:hypothetical protein
MGIVRMKDAKLELLTRDRAVQAAIQAVFHRPRPRFGGVAGGSHRPRFNVLRQLQMSERNFDENGGATPASDVPHARRDQAKAAARQAAIARLPKAKPLKERKKELAAKLRRRKRCN